MGSRDLITDHHLDRRGLLHGGAHSDDVPMPTAVSSLEWPPACVTCAGGHMPPSHQGSPGQPQTCGGAIPAPSPPEWVPGAAQRGGTSGSVGRAELQLDGWLFPCGIKGSGSAMGQKHPPNKVPPHSRIPSWGHPHKCLSPGQRCHHPNSLRTSKSQMKLVPAQLTRVL